MVFKTSNLEELITPFRIQIGDTTSDPTYSDEVLHEVLRQSVAALMVRWHDKYYVDNDGVVNRNSVETFEWSSPPVIQHKDRRPIVLQAAIMIKSGRKFAESGNIQSWRDEEISYSNTESARQLSSTLQEDRAELDSLLPPATRKLARPLMDRLYGEIPDWQE